MAEGQSSRNPLPRRNGGEAGQGRRSTQRPLQLRASTVAQVLLQREGGVCQRGRTQLRCLHRPHCLHLAPL